MIALVFFFSHSRTSDDVPTTAIVDDANVGNDALIKWNGHTYKAKVALPFHQFCPYIFNQFSWMDNISVIFIGRKQICEVKLPLLTGDGELIEDIFDASLVSSSDFGTPRNRSVEYISSNEKETAIRLTAV